MAATVPAAANVVTFTDIPETTIEMPFWVEDGITVEGNASMFGSDGFPDTLHMDGPSLYSSILNVSMASDFDARSVDIIPLRISGVDAFSASCGALHDNCGRPFANVLFEGFADSVLVATLQMWMGAAPFTFHFPPSFAGLSALRLSMLVAADCTESPCTHMNIDNITLAPVPLPATLPLFAWGLAALGAGGLWRRRGRSAQPHWAAAAPQAARSRNNQARRHTQKD